MVAGERVGAKAGAEGMVAKGATVVIVVMEDGAEVVFKVVFLFFPSLRETRFNPSIFVKQSSSFLKGLSHI